MALGFEFRQTMTGTYHKLDTPGDEHPISTTVHVQVHELTRFLLSPSAEITGEIDAEGLADHKALKGTLDFSQLTRRKLVYDFWFPGNDGRDRRFHGDMEVEVVRLLENGSKVVGRIYEDQEEIARVLLHLDIPKELARLIRSFKASA